MSFSEAFGPLFRFPPRDEVAQSADDLAGADRLFGRLVHRRSRFWRRNRVPAGGEQPARAFHVVADRRERLVDLMRQRRGHLPHRAEARHVQQFGLQFLQARLRLLQRRLRPSGAR